MSLHSMLVHLRLMKDRKEGWSADSVPTINENNLGSDTNITASSLYSSDPNEGSTKNDMDLRAAEPVTGWWCVLQMFCQQESFLSPSIQFIIISTRGSIDR